MKKLLVLTILLSALAPIPAKVSAEDHNATTEGNYTTTITKTVGDNYSVLIPKNIDLGNGTSQSFNIQAKGEIAPSKKLKVTVPSTAQMTNSDHSYSSDASIELNNCFWASDVLTSNYTSKSGTVTYSEIKPGSYTGTVDFTIVCDYSGL